MPSPKLKQAEDETDQANVLMFVDGWVGSSSRTREGGLLRQIHRVQQRSRGQSGDGRRWTGSHRAGENVHRIESERPGPEDRAPGRVSNFLEIVRGRESAQERVAWPTSRLQQHDLT